MDKGHEPIERLLLSVTIETNNKNNLMLNHHNKKLISHCLTILVAGRQGLCHSVVGKWVVRSNKRSTESDRVYQPILLKNYPSLRPDSHSCEDNQSPPTAVCSWCNLLLEGLISYRPTASQHPPRGQGSTV